MKLLLGLLALYQFISHAGACGRCPVSCVCARRDAMICRGDNTTRSLQLCNLNLSQIPTFTGIYSSLTTLDLSGNLLTYLEPGALTYTTFPSITNLSLRGNRIREIVYDAIQFPYLLEMDISYNQLSSLGFLAFEESVHTLQTLDLSENSIPYLEHDIFTYHNFPSLVKLKLRGNRIREIESGAIELPSLLELDLSSNQLMQLDFLEDSFSRTTIYLSGNPFICEELADVQKLLCRADSLQTEGVNCSTEAGSELLLVDYCQLASAAQNGPEGGGLSVIVGGTVGGVAVVVIMLLVLVVMSFICLKAARTGLFQKAQIVVDDTEEPSSLTDSPTAFQGHHQHSSVHSAPPTFTPLPPPLDIPPRPAQRADGGGIYAEVVESPPVTSSSTRSGAGGGDPDYEDGYILNVESVPQKSRKNFGTFMGPKSAPLPPIPPRDYETAACTRKDVRLPPSEPTPYCTVPVSEIRPRSQSAKLTGAPGSKRKKKPPVAPRSKQSLRVLEEEDGRERSASVGTHIARRMREDGEKMANSSSSASGSAAGARVKESDYLKVVL